MARKPTTNFPSVKQAEKISRPYMEEIGRLACAWNGLQESLADLFWAILENPNGVVPFAIWHSISSDRSQREMLKAANAKFQWPDRIKHAKKDIEWLLNETGKLADRRNDGLHAPYALITGLAGTEFRPPDHSLNPRATKLIGKDILKELKWYAATATTLHSYSRGIRFALVFPQQHAWPQKTASANSRAEQ